MVTHVFRILVENELNRVGEAQMETAPQPLLDILMLTGPLEAQRSYVPVVEGMSSGAMLSGFQSEIYWY